MIVVISPCAEDICLCYRSDAFAKFIHEYPAVAIIEHTDVYLVHGSQNTVFKRIKPQEAYVILTTSIKTLQASRKWKALFDAPALAV